MKKLLAVLVIGASVLLTGCIGVILEGNAGIGVTNVFSSPALQGSGTFIERNYANEGWTELRLTWGSHSMDMGSIDMFNNIYVEISPYQRDTTFSIDEIHSNHVRVDQRGHVLEIHFDGTLLNIDRLMTIHVGTDNLTRIEHNLSLGIISNGTIVSDRLVLDILGIDRMALDIDVNHLVLDVTGMGTREIRGRALDVYVDKTGMGQTNLSELVSENVTIDMTGIGSIEVNAQESLTIRATGIGSIDYRGNPSVTNINSTGLISVRNVG